MNRLLLVPATVLALAAAVPAAPANAGLCGRGGVVDDICALDPRPLLGCYQPPPHHFEFCV